MPLPSILQELNIIQSNANSYFCKCAAFRQPIADDSSCPASWWLLWTTAPIRPAPWRTCSTCRGGSFPPCCGSRGFHCWNEKKLKFCFKKLLQVFIHSNQVSSYYISLKLKSWWIPEVQRRAKMLKGVQQVQRLGESSTRNSQKIIDMLGEPPSNGPTPLLSRVPRPKSVATRKKKTKRREIA